MLVEKQILINTTLHPKSRILISEAGMSIFQGFI